jgi:hypothetical protein
VFVAGRLPLVASGSRVRGFGFRPPCEGGRLLSLPVPGERTSLGAELLLTGERAVYQYCQEPTGGALIPAIPQI